MKSQREIEEMKQHNLKLPRFPDIILEPTPESEAKSPQQLIREMEIMERPKVQCPVCKKSFVGIRNHLNKSRCKAELGQDELEKIVRETNEKSIQNQRNSAKERKAKSTQRKKDEDHEALKMKERLKKAFQRKSNKEQDQKAFKSSQNEPRSKSKKVETAADRLREFREATMFSALFVCISCHCKHFKSNVQEFTDKIMREIDAKIPLKDCIADLEVKTKIIIVGETTDEDGTRYICKTCLKKLKAGKLPSVSVMNNLQLHETDEQLRQNDLMMTELEGSLIAKNLIFQKIFLLPRSRWTALKDRIINVPIRSEAINETIKMLPRTPNEAGLIGLELKRKIEMKNNHKKQLINPAKIFKWIQRLKESGNPYYEDVSLPEPEDFKRRCRETDKDGYEIIYGEKD